MNSGFGTTREIGLEQLKLVIFAGSALLIIVGLLTYFA